MLRNVIISRLIVKCDLRRGFSHVHIFEKGPIGIVLLLLDSGAKFEERVRNILFRCLQNVDQPKTRWSVEGHVIRGCREGVSLTPLNAPCRFP